MSALTAVLLTAVGGLVGIVVGARLQEGRETRAAKLQRDWEETDRAAERKDEHRRWQRERLLEACTGFIAATEEWHLGIVAGETESDPYFRRAVLAQSQVALVASGPIRAAASKLMATATALEMATKMRSVTPEERSKAQADLFNAAVRFRNLAAVYLGTADAEDLGGDLEAGRG